MWNWIKRLVAGNELRALDRYRQASQLARQWNGEMRQSADTAQWIIEVGEGRLAAGTVSDFREALRDNTSREYLERESIHREYMEKEFQRTINSVAR